MRSYNILKSKAQSFANDIEVKEILAGLAKAGGKDEFALDHYSSVGATKLKDYKFDINALAKRGYGYERLDQLVFEHLMGVRAGVSTPKQVAAVR